MKSRDVTEVDAALAALVLQAAETNAGAERLAAVRALKQVNLGQADAQGVCQFLSVEHHPAVRAAAAQVLGFHGAAAHYAEVKAELLRRAQHERDPLALQALVFGLRNTDGAREFLGHARGAVAVEAVMGLPQDDADLLALLRVLFRTVAPDAAGTICRRLTHWEGAVEGVVAFLMTAELHLSGKALVARVRQVFSHLPQGLLLLALTDVSGEILRTYCEIWPGIWRRERQRLLLDVLGQVVREAGATGDLVDALVQKIASDEVFYDRYLRLIRTLLGGLDRESAGQMLEGCATAGRTADREGLGRLAEALIGLVRVVPALSGRVQDVLSQWEPQLPGIRVKAFYAAER